MKIVIMERMREGSLRLYPHLTEDELKYIISKSTVTYQLNTYADNDYPCYHHPRDNFLEVPKEVADRYRVDYEIPLFLDENGVSFIVVY